MAVQTVSATVSMISLSALPGKNRCVQMRGRTDFGKRLGVVRVGLGELPHLLLGLALYPGELLVSHLDIVVRPLKHPQANEKPLFQGADGGANSHEAEQSREPHAQRRRRPTFDAGRHQGAGGDAAERAYEHATPRPKPDGGGDDGDVVNLRLERRGATCRAHAHDCYRDCDGNGDSLQRSCSGHCLGVLPNWTLCQVYLRKEGGKP